MKHSIYTTFEVLFFACFLAVVTANDASNKIIGGEPDSLSNFPHSAYLKIDYSLACGSSIIRDRILLTAAHCLVGLNENTSTVEARIGHENTYNSPQKIMAIRWIIHDHYIRYVKNDLGLVYLEKSIIFGANVKKALLDFVEPKPGTVCYTAGWGGTVPKDIAKTSSFKSIIQIIQTRTQCQEVFTHIDINKICAKSGLNGQAPYYGDSGSALMYQKFRQVGLVSSGNHKKTDIIMYTAIFPYKEWLQNTILFLEKSC